MTITTSADGKNYTNERFLNKRRKRQCAIDTALANPEWTIPQIQAAVQQAHGDYSEVAVRMALHEAGLKRSKPRTRPKGLIYNADKKREAKPTAPVRAAIHSYSGRSRLSAGYTEL